MYYMDGPMGYTLPALLLGSFVWWLVLRVLRSKSVALPARAPLGVTVVMVSDTHGKHRDVKVPDGDIFVHG